MEKRLEFDHAICMFCRKPVWNHYSQITNGLVMIGWNEGEYFVHSKEACQQFAKACNQKSGGNKLG